MDESAMFEGEGTTNQIMMLEETLEEYAMLAEIGEVEALEPRTLAEARHRPDWTLWEKAIYEELAMLCDAGTWELVDPPADTNIVGSKWVFCVKKDTAGTVICYKAQLVAQGFSQVPVLTTLTPLHLLPSLLPFILF